jgi:hypothetical protein
MQPREVAEILGYLSAAFPKHDLPQETVAVWCDQFASTDFELARDAAKQIVAEDDWFPTIHRFREAVGRLLRAGGAPPGCGQCDRGFVLLADGSAAFCRVCRKDAPLVSGERRALSQGQDWKQGLQSVRAALGEG